MAHQAVATNGLRRDVSGRVEPQRRVWIGNMRIADLIGTRAIEVGEGVRRARNGWRKRKTRLESRDAVESPSAENEIDCTARIVAEMTTATKGQFPNVADRDGVRTIEVRRTAILAPVEVIGEDAAGFGIGHRFAIGVGNQEIEAV